MIKYIFAAACAGFFGGQTAPNKENAAQYYICFTSSLANLYTCSTSGFNIFSQKAGGCISGGVGKYDVCDMMIVN